VGANLILTGQFTKQLNFIYCFNSIFVAYLLAVGRKQLAILTALCQLYTANSKLLKSKPRLFT